MIPASACLTEAEASDIGYKMGVDPAALFGPNGFHLLAALQNANQNEGEGGAAAAAAAGRSDSQSEQQESRLIKQLLQRQRRSSKAAARRSSTPSTSSGALPSSPTLATATLNSQTRSKAQLEIRKQAFDLHKRRLSDALHTSEFPDPSGRVPSPGAPAHQTIPETPVMWNLHLSQRRRKASQMELDLSPTEEDLELDPRDQMAGPPYDALSPTDISFNMAQFTMRD